jgi:hypothetical protein
MSERPLRLGRPFVFEAVKAGYLGVGNAWECGDRKRVELGAPRRILWVCKMGAMQ